MSRHICKTRHACEAEQPADRVDSDEAGSTFDAVIVSLHMCLGVLWFKRVSADVMCRQTDQDVYFWVENNDHLTVFRNAFNVPAI